MDRITRVRGQAAPIAAIAVFGLSISMSIPLLNLGLERMGASGWMIGVTAMFAALGMVTLAPVLPRVLARTGLAPLLVGAGLAMTVVFALFPAVPSYEAWTLLRLVTGLLGTVLFFAAEYWIVAAATPANRGQLVGIYTMALSVSFALGPLIVRVTGTEGWLPFLVGSCVMLIGTLPLFWGRHEAPNPEPGPPPTIRATLGFFVSDPTLLWGVALFGLIEFGTVALLPVWAVRSGLSEDDAVLVMASFAAGSILFAPLIGWAGDRFDRRLLLLGVGIGAVVMPLVAMALASAVWPLIGAGLLWGGTAVGLYALPLTELGARYSGGRLSEGNAAVILAYGIGGLVSPGLLGFAMDAIPPDGLLVVTSVAAMGYVGLATLRILRGGRAVGDRP
ncbi:MAG: MFS transporter [Paracoccaceae bacterium]